MPRVLAKDLDRQILAAQRRFVKAMAERLGTMRRDTKERYFAVLSALVAKLEASDKSIRDVMQEMMGEAETAILHELQG
jgi:hypothetical protein